MLLRKEGQNWSTDAIVAVVIFMVVVLSFLFITGKSGDSRKLERLEDDAKKIPDLMRRSGNLSLNFLMDGNKVDKKKLLNLTTIDYADIKRMVGTRFDFCIHFEDESGNLVFINISDNITGIGSTRAIINNVTCT